LGDSKRRQIEAGKKWCRKNGVIHSDETFFDPAKSGFKGENLADGGELKRFKDLVDNGTIKAGSILLCENFDRISRLKPIKSYSLFLELINAGIGIVFTLSYDQRVIDSDLLEKETGLLQMILGECIRAHAESARKSRLVSEAKQETRSRILKGEVIRHNNVPKYFTWNKDTKSYEHNDKTPLIKDLVADYLNGHSLYSIAGELNRKGVKSMKTQGKWSPRSIKSILTNRVLLGEYMGNKSFFEPIIKQDEFNRLQVLLEQNTHDRGKAADLVNIFKGIVFCKCGKRMNVLSQSTDYRTKKKWKKVYRYIRCCSVAQGQPCEHKFCVPLNQIELEFFVKCLLADPRTLLGNGETDDTKKLRSLVTKHQARINALTDQIKRLVDLSESMPMPELKAKLSRLNTERDAVKAMLDHVNMDLLKTETTPTDFLDVRKIVLASDKSMGKWIDAHTYQFSPQESAFDDMAKKVQSLLQTDNSLRLKLRTILPRVIGKIVVDSVDNRFEVFNHGGKCLYTSMLLA